MKPALYDLEIYQGDDYELFLRIRHKLANGSPGPYMDLTGSTGKAQIRQTEDSTTVLAEFTVTVLDQVVTLGGVLLNLTDAQTAVLAFTGSAKWDFEIVHPGPRRRTYLKGDVTLIKQVTRE